MFAFKMGLLLGFSLIISIGAQNLFLIRQGLKKEYAYLCALVCFACDVLLILLSVGNVGWAVNHYPWLHTLLLVAAILFLLGYGGMSLKSGISNSEDLKLQQDQSMKKKSLWLLILTAVSFSLLNPQAIIDTVVMIGGYASHFPGEAQRPFVYGTLTASLLWFAGLTTISVKFSHALESRRAWQILDISSGLLMVGLAIKLGFSF